MHKRGASLLCLILVLSACAAQPDNRAGVTPIATARMHAAGTRVIVEGIVTVKPGTLDAGFALQDASGGIYVSDGAGAVLAPGDRVRVEGPLATPNGQLAIDKATVVRIGEARVPTPLEVSTGKVGPATEGRLISVRGRVTGAIIDDQPFGWKLYVNDGSGALLIFVATATRIDLKNLGPGSLLRVTGFSGRYAEHTELLPRDAADIAPLESR